MQAGNHKVLVTGASGFYGRHLVPFLQAAATSPSRWCAGTFVRRLHQGDKNH